jgi:hypothetical protein
VVLDAIRRLQNAWPRLTRWLDRPDLQVPAFGASLITHLALLLILALVGYAARTDVDHTFRTEMVNTSLSDFAKLDMTELAETEKETKLTPVAGSFALVTSPLINDSPVPTERPKPNPELAKLDVAVAANIALPSTTRLDQSVSIKGSGAEHVGGVEGAVDRIAVEILRQMERGRTLVIWAFDASGSLVAERQRLAKYIDGVYGHIAEFDQEKLTENEALLNLVVSFGHDRKLMTPTPTSDRHEIISAINAVPLDETGVESTFTTVAEIARKWGRFTKNGDHYRAMIIVVTDEVGDDEDRLEDAIASCQALKTPVYVLGSAALFGRAEGFMDYVDPKTKQVFRNLPVRQGPESVLPEGVRMPFWYDGPQYEFLDAGFGPWALSRLAAASGGIYFVTRMGGHRVMFEPSGMKEYRPDWVSKEQYLKAVNQHAVRFAVMTAAQIAQQNLPQQPPLTFPPVDGPEFKEAMTRNQTVVARIAYTVDAALDPIARASKKRDHETSRRWQAHYDLIRGRLMAMKIRCYEYNWACAKMKKDMPKFTKPSSNAWRLVPDQEVHYSDKAAAAGEEARALLKKVVSDHPGTPWAVLAQRELKDPLGLRWVEITLPPAPKPREQNQNQAKKKQSMPMQKQAQVPKL